MEAQSVGYREVTFVSQTTGVSRTAIYKRIEQVRSDTAQTNGKRAEKIVNPEGGKRKTDKDTAVLHGQEALIAEDVPTELDKILRKELCDYG